MFEDQTTPPNLPVDGTPAPAAPKAPETPAAPKAATPPISPPYQGEERRGPAPGDAARIVSPAAGEPEDIFAKVEPSSTPTPPSHPPEPPLGQGGKIEGRGTLSSASGGKLEGGAEVKEPLVASRKVIVIVGIVLGVAVLTIVAWGLVRFARRAAQPVSSSQTNLPASIHEITPTIPSLPVPLPPEETPTLPGAQLPSEETSETESESETSQVADSDGDGLSDMEEADLGTQATNPDSDSDGLFDGEEVNTYGTDPLSPDTDGDGFLDGQEVRNGYNPNGEGRLFTVPSQ